MSSHPVGRSAATPAKDRASLCLFTFTDGRRCRTPRTTGHPHFCFYHARKESQARVAEKLGNDLNFFLSGEYLSANDLSAALGRIIPAVIRGDIKPRAATTVAYLAQTLLQTIHLAQDEYINAFGTPEWRETIHHNVDQNWNYRNSASPSDPAPTPSNNGHPERSEGSAFDSGGTGLQPGSSSEPVTDPLPPDAQPPNDPASYKYNESDSLKYRDDGAGPANDSDDANEHECQDDEEEDVEFASVGDQPDDHQRTPPLQSRQASTTRTPPATLLE